MLLVGLAVVCVLEIKADENYCDPSLCDNGASHIACDHYLEFAQDCGEEPELITFNAKDKKVILDLHNHHRDRTAAGRLPGYAPAARMPMLKWNEDLAFNAGYGKKLSWKFLRYSYLRLCIWKRTETWMFRELLWEVNLQSANFLLSLQIKDCMFVPAPQIMTHVETL